MESDIRGASLKDITTLYCYLETIGTNNTIANILDKWNENATWASSTNKIGELKRLININLNKWEICEINNCYICNN